MCLFIAVILTVSLSSSLFAKKSVLIDFNLLKANGDGLDPDKSLAKEDAKMKDYTDHDSVNRTQHMSTLLDYSSIAGSNYTEEEKKGMSTSLAAYNWDVVLNSSAAHVENRMYSMCIEWHTKYDAVLSDLQVGGAGGDTAAAKPDGYNVMGIRIHFPETTFNNWALIKPAFEIPAYENKDTDYKGVKLSKDESNKFENKNNKYENGYGVIKNVGIIKAINIRIYGCQFKNSISILLKDDLNILTEYHMDQYLDFDGWRQIIWKNPNYIADAANRDLYIVPLYPRSTPLIKLDGFRIYRQGDQYGGDFVTYIKDVIITYDEATLEREELPIIHEEAWGILQEKTIQAKERELKKIGHTQVLRFLEKKKMHKESTSQ